MNRIKAGKKTEVYKSFRCSTKCRMWGDGG